MGEMKTWDNKLMNNKGTKRRIIDNEDTQHNIFAVAY